MTHYTVVLVSAGRRKVVVIPGPLMKGFVVGAEVNENANNKWKVRSIKERPVLAIFKSSDGVLRQKL